MYGKIFNLNRIDASSNVDSLLGNIAANGRKAGVGYGYNILKYDYLNPVHIETSYPILNLDQVEIRETDPDHVSDHFMETETSIKSLISKVNVKLGVKADYPMFSGKVDTEFDCAKETKQETIYVKALHSFSYKRKYLERDDYEKNLNQKFLSDLNNTALDAKTVLNRYGTHLIINAYIGGRIEINYTFTGYSEENKLKVKVAAEASYNKITGSASVEINSESKQLLEKSIIKILTVGGASQPFKDKNSISEDYVAWVKSLTDEKLWDSCYLPNENSLVPIWNFCDSEDRRVQIMQAFNTMAAEYGKYTEMLDDIGYITDILILSDKNESTAKSYLPKGYILIDKDLNSGAGGNYIYLCYKTGDKKDAVTNLVIQDSKNELKEDKNISLNHNGATAAYHRLAQDLNKGASGAYRYLAFTKGAQYQPIKRLSVLFDEEPMPGDWESACWLNSNESADINRGVKGKYIYIKFMR